MRQKYRFTRSGYCPTQDDKESIEIETTEYPMPGNLTPGYKKGNFYCEFADDHDCDIANDCPIYLESPSNPYLA